MMSARGQTEVVCVSEDSPEVLSHVAGVLSAHRVVIDAATIATVASPQGPVAIQVFMVRDEYRHAIASDDKRWTRVDRDLKAVMASPTRGDEVAKLLDGRNEGFFAKPNISLRDDSQVKIFDGESSDYSVIEVHTSDATGLLHCITGVMGKHGLDIHRAMLSTEGDRVADVFYVQRDGGKLSHDHGEALRAALLVALEDFA